MRLLTSLLGYAPLLVVKRALRDAALVLTLLVVTASAVVLTIALPHEVSGAVDSGAREAIADAGEDAHIEITTEVGTPRANVQLIKPQTAVDLAAGLHAQLPPLIGDHFTEPALSILSPEATVQASPGTGDSTRLTMQIGMLTDASTAALTLTEGAMPSEPRDGERTVIEAVMSGEVAKAASIRLGDVLAVRDANVDDTVVEIVGFVSPLDADDTLWSDSGHLWGASVSRTGAAVGFTVLTTLDGVSAAESLFANPFNATMRLSPVTGAFTSESLVSTAAATRGLQAQSAELAGSSGAELAIRSRFSSALEDYPERARAGIAQMSVLISGVLAVVAAVMLLLSRLLVLRRAPEVMLERSRGASRAAIGIRALLESLVLAAAGVAVGVLVAQWLLPSARVDVGLVALLLLVAVLASPVQAVAQIARVDRGTRRVAANRSDRREGDRRYRARRLVVEGSVIVVAIAALVAIRGRGLLQTRTEGIDPLISAAPVLLAAAVTIVVLRLHPIVVGLAMRIGRRTRGALGTLGAMQAQGALAVIPLATLTIAVALVVSGGLLVDTVRSGQEEGSWQRVGADARVDGNLSDDQLATVREAPGVTAASATLAVGDAHLASGAVTSVLTLFAVDDQYPTVLAQLQPPVKVDFGPVFASVGDDDPLPVFVDSRIARQLDGGAVSLTIGEKNDGVDVTVVGTFDGPVDGYESGPFMYIDRTQLADRIELDDESTTLLVTGDGAEAATADLDGDVTVRATWLADRRHEALVSGVNAVMLLAVGAVTLLALIALLASVLAGARSRRRSLALLRTLGMNSGLGWWLALAELAPLVIAAVVGGVAAGVGIVIALGPALGLETLAGGVAPPSLTISPVIIASVAAGAVVLSLVAILAEVVLHRRDRLGSVLRVGESS